MVEMLAELIAKPETDLVSALEDRIKFAGKFYDLRLEKTVLALADHHYVFDNFYTQLTFLDEMWVLANLSWKIGRQDIYLDVVGMLGKYDPYQSKNSLIKGLAYYDAVERSTSLLELETVVDSAKFYLGKDELAKRFKGILGELSAKKRVYLGKLERHRKKITAEIEVLAGKADLLVKDWELSQAASLYERAEELAEYQLGNKELAVELRKRFRSVSEELVVEEKKNSF
ncbi:MAG: hypothetical protein ABIA37_00065 [Candidatus Woesearchaeota archaeon]